MVNRPKRNIPNTGDYADGLGNLVTVHAVGNPAKQNRKGVENTLHDKASGYGILRCDPSKQNYTLECWRLQFDAEKPQPEDQFPGWPLTVGIDDQYGRAPVAHLPTLKFSGLKNPVVQVIHEKTGETIYTRRIKGTSFSPKVFEKNATYTLIAGDPDNDNLQTHKNLKPSKGQLKLNF